MGDNDKLRELSLKFDLMMALNHETNKQLDESKKQLYDASNKKVVGWWNSGIDVTGKS